MEFNLNRVQGTVIASGVTGAAAGIGALGVVVNNAIKSGSFMDGLKSAPKVDLLQGNAGKVVVAVAITFVALMALGIAFDGYKYVTREKKSEVEKAEEAEAKAKTDKENADKEVTKATNEFNAANIPVATLEAELAKLNAKDPVDANAVAAKNAEITTAKANQKWVDADAKLTAARDKAKTAATDYAKAQKTHADAKAKAEKKEEKKKD